MYISYLTVPRLMLEFTSLHPVASAAARIFMAVAQRRHSVVPGRATFSYLAASSAS